MPNSKITIKMVGSELSGISDKVRNFKYMIYAALAAESNEVRCG
jgi:hypothetical protein